MHRVCKPLAWSALLLLTVVPVLAGLAQRRSDGWYPESDDATIVLLSDDVLRGDPPLVGMISTGGAHLSDPELHHPGPLELYLIAPFSRAMGPDLGPVVAAALISIASVAVLVLVLHSIGGRSLGAVGFVTSGLILWGIGGDAPTSVWNPYVVLLPFACFLVTCLGVAARRWWALLGVVAFGSLVAQTHLSYAGLVGALVAWSVVLTAWRSARGDTGARLPAAASLGLGLLLWLPPIIDQLSGEPGNLGQIWRSLTGPGGTSVGSAGLGELSRVVGVPLLGMRPRGELVRVLPDLAPLDLVRLALLATLLIGCAIVTSRSGRAGAAVTATLGVALVAGCLTAVRIPLSDGVQYQYYGMWMWPLAGVVWTFVAWACWRLVPAALAERVRGVATSRPAPAVLALAVLGCTALPRPGAWEPWTSYRRVAGDLAPVAAAVDGPGPVLVRFRGATPYLSTGSAAVLSISHGGPEVLVDPGAPTPVFPWREARRFTDQELDREVWVVGGPGDHGRPVGADLIARSTILDESQRRRLESDLSEAQRVVLDGVEPGPRAPESPEDRERVDAAVADPAVALTSGELASLAARGLVTVRGLSADRLVTLDRMSALAAESDVSLYLVTREGT